MYDSLAHGLLSVAFVCSLRTADQVRPHPEDGNAGALWAYHAIASRHRRHALIVRVSGFRRPRRAAPVTRERRRRPAACRRTTRKSRCPRQRLLSPPVRSIAGVVESCDERRVEEERTADALGGKQQRAADEECPCTSIRRRVERSRGPPPPGCRPAGIHLPGRARGQRSAARQMAIKAKKSSGTASSSLSPPPSR